MQKVQVNVTPAAPRPLSESNAGAVDASDVDTEDSDILDQLSSDLNKSRRVSFAEGVDIIKQNTLDQSALSDIPSSPIEHSSISKPSAASTSGKSPLHAETLGATVENEHPVTEPEGKYLGKPILIEEDSVDGSKNTGSSTNDSSS